MPEASPITTSVTYLISSARGWNIGIGRRSRQSSFPQLPLSQQRSSISSTPRNLYEHNELYQWRTTGSGDVSDGPRRKCIIMSNVDGDDRVLRGELVSICRITIHILGRRVYVSDMVAPVPHPSPLSWCTNN